MHRLFIILILVTAVFLTACNEDRPVQTYLRIWNNSNSFAMVSVLSQDSVRIEANSSHDFPLPGHKAVLTASTFPVYYTCKGKYLSDRISTVQCYPKRTNVLRLYADMGVINVYNHTNATAIINFPNRTVYTIPAQDSSAISIYTGQVGTCNCNYTVQGDFLWQQNLSISAIPNTDVPLTLTPTAGCLTVNNHSSANVILRTPSIHNIPADTTATICYDMRYHSSTNATFTYNGMFVTDATQTVLMNRGEAIVVDVEPNTSALKLLNSSSLVLSSLSFRTAGEIQWEIPWELNNMQPNATIDFPRQTPGTYDIRIIDSQGMDYYFLNQPLTLNHLTNIIFTGGSKRR